MDAPIKVHITEPVKHGELWFWPGDEPVVTPAEKAELAAAGVIAVDLAEATEGLVSAEAEVRTITAAEWEAEEVAAIVAAADVLATEKTAALERAVAAEAANADLQQRIADLEARIAALTAPTALSESATVANAPKRRAAKG